MFAQENMPNERKHVVSMRLTNNDRSGIQQLSSRLFIREADLYRFAVNSLLNRMSHLNDDGKRGSDLLPLFANFRHEINEYMRLTKQQLYKIINAGNADPDKLVCMSDIELLLLSDRALRRQLMQLREAIMYKDKDTTTWLTDYFVNKYYIEEPEEIDVIETKDDALFDILNLNQDYDA